MNLDAVRIVGTSMGGMIAAILATRFRSRLPVRASFVFAVTTSNGPGLPKLTEDVLASWKTARPGDVESFAKLLGPFFSPSFLAEKPAVAENYFAYRARGENAQSGGAFLRQVDAYRKCDATPYFAAVDPAEALFVHGAEDRVLDGPHAADLRRLAPRAKHVDVPHLGHMIHVERPDILGHLFAGRDLHA
jgi:pimeloyl-ACP methyl ester carboxylesterase